MTSKVVFTIQAGNSELLRSVGVKVKRANHNTVACYRHLMDLISFQRIFLFPHLFLICTSLLKGVVHPKKN